MNVASGSVGVLPRRPSAGCFARTKHRKRSRSRPVRRSPCDGALSHGAASRCGTMQRSSSPANSRSVIVRSSRAVTTTFTSGASAWTRVKSGGRTSASKRSGDAMRKVRRAVPGSNAGARIACPRVVSPLRSGITIASARGVSTMPAGPRTSSESPSSARSRERAWLTADCVSPRRSAARVTPRSWTSASNITSRLRSIAARASMALAGISSCTAFMDSCIPTIGFMSSRHPDWCVSRTRVGSAQGGSA